MRVKKGFTAVEVLIAAVVLSLLLTVGYEAFMSFTASFNKGSWSLNAQNKLRDALTFVREEMQKAAYKTSIRINGTSFTSAGYEFCITDSTAAGDAPDDDKIKVTDGKIAEWFICLPAVAHSPETDPGAEFKCTLRLSDGKLMFTKIKTAGSDPRKVEHEVTDRVLAENVDYVLLKLTPPESSNGISLLAVKVKISHPDKRRYANTTVTSETAAKIEIEVKAGF